MILPPHLQHLQHLQGEDLKAAIQHEYYAQAIAFIVRQTDYTEEAAAERLGELKDPVKVVQSYLGLGLGPETTSSSKSKHQMKYGEIRKFMDEGTKQYNAQTERRACAKCQEYLEQHPVVQPQQTQGNHDTEQEPVTGS